MSNQLKAMLLDPSHESAAHIKMLLERSHVELVEWAVSGTGWITPFQQKKPDMLLIDYLLPKRDGCHCLMKALHLLPSTKVVLLHSYSGAMANEIELKAFALGASAVAQRPLVESRFSTLISRLSSATNWEKQQASKSLVLVTRDDSELKKGNSQKR